MCSTGDYDCIMYIISAGRGPQLMISVDKCLQRWVSVCLTPSPSPERTLHTRWSVCYISSTSLLWYSILYVLYLASVRDKPGSVTSHVCMCQCVCFLIYTGFILRMGVNILLAWFSWFVMPKRVVISLKTATSYRTLETRHHIKKVTLVNALGIAQRYGGVS